MIPDTDTHPWGDSAQASEPTGEICDPAERVGDFGVRHGDSTDELDESGEPVVEIRPRARPEALRIVGPGRKERAYLEDRGRLELELARRERALAIAALVERGAARAMDRLEGEIAARRRDHQALLQDQRRLVLALGAVQRENEILREKLALSAGAPRALGPARRETRASVWSRVFTRRRS